MMCGSGDGSSSRCQNERTNELEWHEKTSSDMSWKTHYKYEHSLLSRLNSRHDILCIPSLVFSGYMLLASVCVCCSSVSSFVLYSHFGWIMASPGTRITCARMNAFVCFRVCFFFCVSVVCFSIKLFRRIRCEPTQSNRRGKKLNAIQHQSCDAACMCCVLCEMLTQSLVSLCCSVSPSARLS